ncbi:hypothetical protein HAZT_HAZT000854, partial [Hyalella azteca]
MKHPIIIPGDSAIVQLMIKDCHVALGHLGRSTMLSYLRKRAIHLELSYSLTTDSFIRALRRFTCRRGVVSSLISDNGTNFTGANAELRGAIKQWSLGRVEAWLKQKGISWKVNPPYASHYGGFFCDNRCLQCVRKKILILKAMENWIAAVVNWTAVVTKQNAQSAKHRCEICKETFSTKGNMKRHRLTKHQRLPRQA